VVSSRRHEHAAVLAALAVLAAGAGAGVYARQLRPSLERPVGPIVDFVAVQADGAPVVGLQPAEVEVKINGRARTLRSLRRVATSPLPVVPGVPPGLPAPFGTNDSVAVGRTVAFVVDQESFATGSEPLLRSAVDGLLTAFTPADRALVVALPFGGVKADFTSDAALIRRAMGGVSAQGSRTQDGSDLACRTRRFLEALEGFLQGQSGRSSPLTVVLFTAGLAAPRRDASMLRGPGPCELLVEDFKRITVASGTSRANVFVVLPDDLGGTGERWRDSIGGAGFVGSDNPLEGIEHLTGSTGGVRLPLDARGTGALQRVASESSAYYEAELVPERDEVFGRSRILAVRVLRRDVTVRARPEITFAKQPRGAPTPRLALSDLLVSREAYADVRLRVGGFTLREPDGRLRVGVVVEPDDPSTSLDSVGAVLVDASGQVVARWFAVDALKRPLLGAVAASPGTYRLRVVAIDSARRYGAAEDVVQVGLTPVGPLSLGSMMLGLSRDDGVAPRLQFGAEPTVIASFDIYGGAAGMPISAALELAREPEGPAIASLPVTLARAGESRVVATGVVPIGALPPGDYAVRGVVRLEDGTTGRVSRTLRKVAQ
jgi:hypothetical protein